MDREGLSRNGTVGGKSPKQLKHQRNTVPDRHTALRADELLNIVSPGRNAKRQWGGIRPERAESGQEVSGADSLLQLVQRTNDRKMSRSGNDTNASNEPRGSGKSQPRKGIADRSVMESTRPLDVRVPPGAPAWVTDELIELTIRTWQPYYQTPLSPDDALTMILNVGRLYGVLSGDRGS